MTRLEKKHGIIAGISLIIMAVAAGFSYGYVQNIIIGDTAEITASNLTENTQLFNMSIAGWIIILITDLIVSVSFYHVFKGTHKKIARVSAFIRIVYSVILAFAIYQLIIINPSANANKQGELILEQFNNFEMIWSGGLIVFGLHLIGLAYLSLKSLFIPGILGYLLYIGGAAYVLIDIIKTFALTNQSLIINLENIFAIPMALGELLLAAVLIYKGFKTK